MELLYNIYIYIYIYIYVIMKTMCPLGYHHNGFVATHALGHMMYGYTLLVPMNQRVLNKLSKDHKIRCQRALFGSLLPAMCNRTSWTQVHELLQSCFCEIWALCVSWITYDHLYIHIHTIYIHWYQQCGTIYHMPKCMSGHLTYIM